MQLAQTYLTEFEQEAPVTRRFLERLPEDKLSWRPHERSMTAGQLALHIAMAPGQVAKLVALDSAPAPDFQQPNPEPKSRQEVLDAFDQSIAEVRGTLPAISDERMRSALPLVNNGQEILAMPRTAFLRNILLNHWYQHRGQFGVYLRLLGQKVPSSYGPSADEMPEFLPKKAMA
jgi:uncharacterized damage-inducible protein DinB